ncbi:winged helix DNA-binding domain-containing protein [Cellulosimicrobium marinum]|uniref:winged helix DNA-binding domain-containing protein n=1 Tax=Cellulosimicrobium marinum TaxID=1638992 RepID=UPI001E33C076|nr:winged helix DNA-binding domain-containing protein [Cellulosimicrobium marinum]MCB7135831.1 winged helix DNA-binding domain-containing protein [Cellulosimicrobium marinum]
MGAPSHRALNRATLARQQLLARADSPVPDVVRRVVALQAQHPASPYVALWNRVAGFDPADLDAAIADRGVVKGSLLRVALHLVHGDDYATVHTAMQPTLRGSRLHDPRFAVSGISIDEAHALVPDLLAFAATPRSAAELEAWVDERVPDVPRGAWWALRTFAPLHHVPTGGPWGFGTRTTFVAAGTPALPRDTTAPDAALADLVLRYLSAFGPATVPDVAQFALVPRARVRAAVATLGDAVDRFPGPDGGELLDVPGAPLPDEDVPAPPRLLGMWDETLLAYADRSRVLPPDLRPLVTRSNGDVLATALVDGYVAGVWRTVDQAVEVTTYRPVPDAAWPALEDEARSLVAFLADRDPHVFSRYGHWWDKLPPGEVRTIGSG